jgi:O-antigen ligase
VSVAPSVTWRLLAVVWAPLALIGVLLLQLMLGQIAYSQQALLAIMYLVYFALLCWLGYTLRVVLDFPLVARVLAWCLLAGGVASAMIAVVQHFGWHGMLDGWVNAASGATTAANLAQVNHLADYLALALGSLGYLWHARRLPGMLALPFALLLLAALAFSGSRSSWLYLAALIGVALAARKQIGKQPLIWALLLLPAFAMVQGLMHVSWLAGSVATVTPTERLFSSVSGIDARLALWGASWRIFLDAPLLGVGFGQFAYALFTRMTEGSVLSDALFNHAHNLPMQLLAEFGLIGFGIVAWGLGAWLVRSLREVWSAERAWMFALLSVLLIHSLLEYPLWYAYFLGMAAFLIGAGETHTMRLRVSGVGRTGFVLALLLATVALLRLRSDFVEIDHAVLKSRERTAIPEVQATLARMYRESLLAPYVEHVYAFGIELDREEVADKLELNTQVMHFAPTRETVYRQATLLALANQPQAARSMLTHALAAYPNGAAEFIQTAHALETHEAAAIEPLRALAETYLLNHKQQGVQQ